MSKSPKSWSIRECIDSSLREKHVSCIFLCFLQILFNKKYTRKPWYENKMLLQSSNINVVKGKQPLKFSNLSTSKQSFRAEASLNRTAIYFMGERLIVIVLNTKILNPGAALLFNQSYNSDIIGEFFWENLGTGTAITASPTPGDHETCSHPYLCNTILGIYIPWCFVCSNKHIWANLTVLDCK